jgi:hypothetical protein
MTVKVILVDVSPKVVAAWRDVFEDNPEVTVTQGSMLDQHVDAWVTSTNARGAMDSGLDNAIRNHLGAQVQTRVQQAIAMNFRGNPPGGRGDLRRHRVRRAAIPHLHPGVHRRRAPGGRGP